MEVIPSPPPPETSIKALPFPDLSGRKSGSEKGVITQGSFTGGISRISRISKFSRINGLFWNDPFSKRPLFPDPTKKRGQKMCERGMTRNFLHSSPWSGGSWKSLQPGRGNSFNSPRHYKKWKMTLKKSFRAKRRGNVALESPRTSLTKGTSGHLGATFLVREVLALLWRVFCFRGRKLPQAFYNLSNHLGTTSSNQAVWLRCPGSLQGGLQIKPKGSTFIFSAFSAEQKGHFGGL